MSTSKPKIDLPKIILVALIAVAVVMFGVTGYFSYQFYGIERCPACGMLITTEMEEHFVIYDGEGNRVWSCCQGCFFRLLDPYPTSNPRGWEELHIETFCDWYGPDYKIKIDAYEHGKRVEYTPDTALVIFGRNITGSCASNRFAYNETAAEMLLEHGYSKYTMKFQRAPLVEGAESLVFTPAEAGRLIPWKWAGIDYHAPPLFLTASFAIIGVVILVAAIVSYVKFMRPVKAAEHSPDVSSSPPK
jgi:hypothetical protein